MRKILTLVMGLASVGVLAVVCADRYRAPIEAELTAKTYEKLVLGGLAQVRVDAVGQTIILSGRVPDADSSIRARAIAESVRGVAEVRNSLTVDPIIVWAPRWTDEQRTQANSCQHRFSALLNRPILFDPKRSAVDPRSLELLDQLAEAAKACPVAEISVFGAGVEQAELLAHQMVQRGIEADRLWPETSGDRRAGLKVRGIE